MLHRSHNHLDHILVLTELHLSRFRNKKSGASKIKQGTYAEKVTHNGQRCTKSNVLIIFKKATWSNQKKNVHHETIYVIICVNQLRKEK